MSDDKINNFIDNKSNIISNIDSKQLRRRELIEKFKKKENIEYSIEKFIDDEEIIKEHKRIFDPLKKNAQYAIGYWILASFGIIRYIKNSSTKFESYFVDKSIRMRNLVMLSVFHGIAFAGILFGGSFALMGINPIKFYKRLKLHNANIAKKDELKDLTWDEFAEIVDIKNQLSIKKGVMSKFFEEKTDEENNENKENLSFYQRSLKKLRDLSIIEKEDNKKI